MPRSRYETVVKIETYMPTKTLRAIDKRAKDLEMSRDAFLNQAAQAHLLFTAPAGDKTTAKKG